MAGRAAPKTALAGNMASFFAINMGDPQIIQSSQWKWWFIVTIKTTGLFIRC
jgi:hypothetical protein